MIRLPALLAALVATLATQTPSTRATAQDPRQNRTTVTIERDQFLINGKLTYAGRHWNGHRIEGLLLNARLVQGIFDDTNPETRDRWAYPDTKRWDPERNTREFCAAMPAWRAHGLLAFTLNLQGGSPTGYSNQQPWINSAFLPDGSLDTAYLPRLERILNRADELGMVVILGLFYFGQDQHLKDETAILHAVDTAIDWIHKQNYRHILLEINNECDVKSYDHDILKPDRVHELIRHARLRSQSLHHAPLLVGTSYGGGAIPGPNVVQSSDFLLLHGNGVSNPDRIAQMVRQTRQLPGYRPMPILFNEDDHFDFQLARNNFTAAIAEYASWGLFDYRMKEESFDHGFQSVPVNWQISSVRKRAFFQLLSTITGSQP